MATVMSHRYGSYLPSPNAFLIFISQKSNVIKIAESIGNIVSLRSDGNHHHRAG